MKRLLLVAGSGKMARDIGLFFLRQGHPVAWLSHDAGRLAELERYIGRAVRRLSRIEPERDLAPPSFHLYDSRDVPTPAILIEAVRESRPAKADAFRQLAQLADDKALLLSNSSSILPAEIHPRCVGVHFFYPVELTGFVEVILPETAAPRRERVAAFLAEGGIEAIEQTPATAFAANRLLLPLQAECFRRIRSGWPAAEVDAASQSCLAPMGQLRLIDSVGLDVFHSAVCNYLRRMPAPLAAECAPLRDALAEVVALGKRGMKNGDGLLGGRPLPWPAAVQTPADRRRLAETSLALLANSCYHFLRSGHIDRRGLDLVLGALFRSACSLEEAVARRGAAAMGSLLAERHRETGLSYFAPAIGDTMPNGVPGT